MVKVHSTELGHLYQGDCLELFRALPDKQVHTIFADPPFNLGKDYGSNGSDHLSESDYLVWCERWLTEANRVLVPGGALFVYNLPKWLLPIGAHLTSLGLVFKHWIAIHKPTSLPIPNRLCPSHYGLLYFVKGDKPRVFNRDAVRVAIRKCRHCRKDIKDYGGHKKHLNPKGLNLSDVWDDVPPVRHQKYKSRPANELAPIILERIIGLSTRKGDIVLDPFAGSGTTAFVAETLGRRWICCELNDCTIARRRVMATKDDDGCSMHSAKRRSPLVFDVLSEAFSFRPERSPSAISVPLNLSIDRSTRVSI